jgi:hypothetical protein
VNEVLAEAVVSELSLGAGQGPGPEVWRTFGEGAWNPALGWLDLSGLAIYFRRRLELTERLGLIPAAVRQRLDRCAAENKRRTGGMLDELEGLQRIFRVAGIPLIVLKGVTLAPDYCDDPALRTQYDHDFLVPPPLNSRAHRALEADGYRRKNPDAEHPAVYRRPGSDVRFAADFVGFYAPGLPRSIELHVNLWEKDDDKIDIDMHSDLFERAVRRQVCGVECLSLSDEDALIFQVLHAFRHIIRNWCRLSVFLEIGHFLNRRASDALFWKRFTARIERLRWVREAATVVFGLAGLLFNASVPAEFATRPDAPSSLSLGFWLKKYGRRSALSNFRANKYSLILHAQFVDDPAAWSAIRRQRLFPCRRPHRPPAEVFQRGFSKWEKWRVNSGHGLGRFKFHAIAALTYAWACLEWEYHRKTGTARKATSKLYPTPELGASVSTKLEGH